jgi:predicted GH43/DUF377 family glycosyl hydrolase
MTWTKLGLIWGPDGRHAWARHSALQPTAIALRRGEIRVFVGLRDEHGVSRVGYVDLDAGDPTHVLRESRTPVLDVGVPGAFDDNGVVPTAIVRRPDALYLYYAGYQLSTRVRFLVFTGLAVSHDDGETFTRCQQVPVTDRTSDERCFRVIHSIFEEGGVWRAWYGAGSSFVEHEGRMLPVYDIRYMESADGVTFPETGDVVIPLQHPDEHRVGRPYVLKHRGRYAMFFGAATKRDNYRLAYAESPDGLTWTRNDAALEWPAHPDSWEAEMTAYPCVIAAEGRHYLFYNGNDFGRRGFGCAILDDWE